MRTADFDFTLPPELIAQTPAPERDQSRLLVLHRTTGAIEHRRFRDLLEYLRPGDVLVLNDSRVIPARLRAMHTRSGGRFEVLLLEEVAPNEWWTMMRPGKRARVGTRLAFQDSSGRPGAVQAGVVATNDEGHRRLHFSGTNDLLSELGTLGEVPLPPYIQRSAAGPNAEDRERYQTVFASPVGSIAAPTAGLHFTAALLDQIRSRGVRVCFITLHVGLGTFAPVKTELITAHRMHEEQFALSERVAGTINEARRSGGRVFAVGTTTVRVLEAIAARNAGRLAPAGGRTRIFIHPPYAFQVVDALLTNFHLPRSTLLMLVSAFAAPGELRGRDLVLAAYAQAAQERYRFFSYGDAMLVL